MPPTQAIAAIHVLRRGRDETIPAHASLLMQRHGDSGRPKVKPNVIVTRPRTAMGLRSLGLLPLLGDLGIVDSMLPAPDGANATLAIELYHTWRQQPTPLEGKWG